MADLLGDSSNVALGSGPVRYNEDSYKYSDKKARPRIAAADSTEPTNNDRYTSTYRVYPRLIEIYLPKPVNSRSLLKQDVYKLPAIDYFTPTVLDLAEANLPPLLKKSSSTLSSPFKEAKFNRSISDSIGNSYSSFAKDISLKHMQPRSRIQVSGMQSLPIISISPPMSPLSRKNIPKGVNLEKNSFKLDVSLLDPIEIESKIISRQITPDQRYWYYIECEIPELELYKIDAATLTRIKALVCVSPCVDYLPSSYEKLVAEIKACHIKAIKKAIIDYILIDNLEQERLYIPSISQDYIYSVCRAPVPWSSAFAEARAVISETLMINNPMMIELLKTIQCKPIVLEVPMFNVANCPVAVEDFEAQIRANLANLRSDLLNR